MRSLVEIFTGFSNLLPRIEIETLKNLKQFHAQIVRRSLHGENYWHTFLLGHCARLHAPLYYTNRLFHTISNPNQYAFTVMLKFYSQLGHHHSAALLFVGMLQLGVRPDAFVFPPLMKSSSPTGLIAVDIVHGIVVKVGCGADRYVRNSVIDGYARQGEIATARRVFDGISQKVVSDWNAMISAYWRCGDEDNATDIFASMSDRNIVTWTAMITGYMRYNLLRKARSMFDQMPERNVISWNALLSGYVQNGEAETALELFGQMADSGVSPDETTWVTVISACSSNSDPNLAETVTKPLHAGNLNCFVKTALVDMYSKCGNLEKARQIFDEMNNRNVVTWNAMISGYARASDVQTAKKLFDRTPRKNVITWNSMISCYVQNGLWESAISLFKVMVDNKSSSNGDDDLKPDDVTMVSVISACGHLGALETGNWVKMRFLDKYKNQIKLTTSLSNSLVFMFSRCGKMDSAKKVFNEMSTRDIFSYNSLINGFATHGHAVEALALLSQMNREGVKPDRITFIGILTACSHSGLLDEGRKIFAGIKTPSVDHYACMIDLLGRASRLNEAKKMIDDMPMKAHAGVYGSLLNASRVHRRVDLGEFAAHKLFVLEPENSGNYVLLANIYASANRWEDVERIRAMMREKGISKTTGCSWVEFDGKRVRFIAGDRSNEHSDSIYQMLNIVGRKMRENLGYIADKSCVLRDVEEEEKEEMIGAHSEKLAVAFKLLMTRTTEKEVGTVIRVVKNLRICPDCHVFMKMVSKLECREIVVRDNNRFHCFKDGHCSCKDYW